MGNKPSKFDPDVDSWWGIILTELAIPDPFSSDNVEHFSKKFVCTVGFVALLAFLTYLYRSRQKAHGKRVKDKNNNADGNGHQPPSAPPESLQEIINSETTVIQRDNAVGKIEKLSTELTHSRGKIIELEAAVTFARNDTEFMTKRCRELDEENNFLRRERERLLPFKETFNATCDELNSMFAHRQDYYVAKIKTLRYQLVSSSERETRDITRLEKELERAVAANRELNSRLKREQRCQRSYNRFDNGRLVPGSSTSGAVSSSVSAKPASDKKLVEAATRATELDAIISEQAKKISTLNKEKAQETEKSRRLSTELEDLRHELSKCKASTECHTKKSEDLESRQRKLENGLKDQNTELKEKAKKMTDLEADRRQIHSDNAELHAQLRQPNTAYQCLHGIHAQCNTDQLTAQVGQLLNNLSSLQAQSNLQASELLVANQRVAQQQFQLDEARTKSQRFEELQQQLAEATNLLQQLGSNSETIIERYRQEGEQRVRHQLQSRYEEDVGLQKMLFQDQGQQLLRAQNDLKLARSQAKTPLNLANLEIRLQEREREIETREKALRKIQPVAGEDEMDLDHHESKQEKEVAELKTQLAKASKEAADLRVRSKYTFSKLEQEKKARAADNQRHEKQMHRVEEEFKKRGEVLKMRLEKENPLNATVAKLRSENVKLQRELEMKEKRREEVNSACSSGPQHQGVTSGDGEARDDFAPVGHDPAAAATSNGVHVRGDNDAMEDATPEDPVAEDTGDVTTSMVEPPNHLEAPGNDAEIARAAQEHESELADARHGKKRAGGHDGPVGPPPLPSPRQSNKRIIPSISEDSGPVFHSPVRCGGDSSATVEHNGSPAKKRSSSAVDEGNKDVDEKRRRVIGTGFDGEVVHVVVQQEKKSAPENSDNNEFEEGENRE